MLIHLYQMLVKPEQAGGDGIARNEAYRPDISAPQGTSGQYDMVRERVDLCFPIHQRQDAVPHAYRAEEQLVIHPKKEIAADKDCRALMQPQVDANVFLMVAIFAQPPNSVRQRAYHVQGLLIRRARMNRTDHLGKMHPEQCGLPNMIEIYLRHRGSYAVAGEYESIALKSLQYVAYGSSRDTKFTGKIVKVKPCSRRVGEQCYALPQRCVDCVEPLAPGTGVFGPTGGRVRIWLVVDHGLRWHRLYSHGTRGSITRCWIDSSSNSKTPMEIYNLAIRKSKILLVCRAVRSVASNAHR